MPESPEKAGVVGKYRVVRKLGEGGMGVVYEAENTFTGKRVAIKRLHPQLLADQRSVERFIREARVAARVRHPNVVDLYDVDSDRDGPFLVMEYLEGESLASYLEHGRPSLRAILTLLCPAMRGAAAAHKKGIVHRDIKPENIFLAREEDDRPATPKVLDFGVSKLMTPESSALRLTRTGALVGTPGYMSYEHLAGMELDQRTDVYSFGVILFEALTGHHPYGSASFPVLLGMMVTRDPTPLRTYRPDLSVTLERVITSALQKNRDQRTPSLDALIAELTPFLREPLPSPVLPPRSERPRPNFAHPAELIRAPAASAWTVAPPRAPARHRQPVLWLVAMATLAGILVGWLLFRLR